MAAFANLIAAAAQTTATIYGARESRKAAKEGSKFVPSKAETTEEAAEHLLQDEEDNKRRRVAAATQTGNWLAPTLSRPGLLGR